MANLWGWHSTCISRTLETISAAYPNKKFFLDVGCGDGTRTLLFDSSDRDICGVDRLDWRNDRSRERIRFKELDFVKEPLPYKDTAFDMVFSFDVVEHLPLPEIMLREIRRVLKDDGVFVVATPNRHRILNFILLALRLRKIPYAPDPHTVATDPYAWHVIEYTSRGLEKLLTNAGFDVIRKHKLFYGLTGGFGFTYLFGLPFYHNLIFECKKTERI